MRATAIGRAGGFVLLCALFAASAEARGPFRIGGVYQDYAWATTTGADGSIYVVGNFKGRVDFDPQTAAERAGWAREGPEVNRRSADAFLVKYDPDGDFEWLVTMGGGGMNVARTVTVDHAGVVCVGGGFSGRVDFDRSTPASDLDTMEAGKGRNAFIACYGPEGDFRWVRGFGDDDVAPEGSKELSVEWSEGTRGIACDRRGNVYAVGLFRGVIDLDPGEGKVERTSRADSRDAFLVSLDTEGHFRWGRSLGGFGLDQGQAIAVRDDTLVVGGCFSGPIDLDPGGGTCDAVSAGDLDAFLVWFELDGTFRLGRTWGGPGLDEVNSGALALDQSGAVYAGGEFRGSVDFDPGKRRDVHESEGESDAFVVRYDAKGKFDWAVTFGDSGTDSVHALCIDADRGVAVAGRFQRRVDFAPGKRKLFLEAQGQGHASDAFVAAYDRRGKCRWAHALGAKVGGPGMLTRGTGVAPQPGGRIAFVGTFYGNVDVDPGKQQLLLQNMGEADIFVVRYDAKGDYVQ